jgi:hypothetical protein
MQLRGETAGETAAAPRELLSMLASVIAEVRSVVEGANALSRPSRRPIEDPDRAPRPHAVPRASPPEATSSCAGARSHAADMRAAPSLAWSSDSVDRGGFCRDEDCGWLTGKPLRRRESPNTPGGRRGNHLCWRPMGPRDRAQRRSRRPPDAGTPHLLKKVQIVLHALLRVRFAGLHHPRMRDSWPVYRVVEQPPKLVCAQVRRNRRLYERRLAVSRPWSFTAGLSQNRA